METILRMCWAMAALFVLIAADLFAFEIDPLFTDHMVLQRRIPIKIRGWASAGTNVTASVSGKKATAKAGADGKWIAILPAMKAGGPHVLTVTDGRETVTLRDVLVGDVWLCSGQSNMGHQVREALNPEKEIAAANHPRIRLFKVAETYHYKPIRKLKAGSEGWNVCSPASIPLFSAAGYFFARDIQKQIDVPIGLIQSAWSGTRIESWTSLDGLRTVPGYEKGCGEIETWRRRNAKQLESYVHGGREKDIATLKTLPDDVEAAAVYAAVNVDDKSWGACALPADTRHIRGLGWYFGQVWFRRTVEIPTDMRGKELILSLPPMEDVDVTFFNGKKIGRMGGFDKDKKPKTPRNYTVPAKLNKSSKAVIAIMVCNKSSICGFSAKGEMKLSAGGRSIDLAGGWKYHAPFRLRPKYYLQHKPTCLYNAMIAPLQEFPIAGALWYQGESNSDKAYQYRDLFPAMINDWRAKWGQGDFPFYYVQLTAYHGRWARPKTNSWPELREAQTMALCLPNTGMAVTIDIGDVLMIHPRNKQDVGRRLAQNALVGYYGRKSLPCGPIYESVKFRDGKATVRFRYVGSGLVVKGQALDAFKIAGEDRRFVSARAQVVGNTVVVSAAAVSNPVAVRYGWDWYPRPMCNLYNKEGFPASPFRTDDWPGVTFGKK